MTVLDAFTRYLRGLRDRVGPADLATRAYWLWAFAERFGDRPAEQVDESDIRAFVQGPRDTDHWSPNTRRRAACLVREALATKGS